MSEQPQTDPMCRSAIPTVVLTRICQHLHLDHAQRALRDVMLASRESYEIAAPLLYLDVYIEPSSVDSLMRGLELTSEAPGPLQGSRYPWHHNDYDHAGFSARILALMDDLRTDESNGTPRPPPFKAIPQKEEEREFREMLDEAVKARLEEYLRSITTAEVSLESSPCKLDGSSLTRKKPTLSLPTDMLGDYYPNLISHARKLALFHRTTRVIISDDISADVVWQLHHLARTTENLLFPSVRTLVVQERVDGPFTAIWMDDRFARRVASCGNFLKVIFQMACPTTICVWDDLTSRPPRVDFQVHPPQIFQDTRPNPGRVRTCNFHRVFRQTCTTYGGVTNRYFFTFDPESALREMNMYGRSPDTDPLDLLNQKSRRGCTLFLLVLQAVELSNGARTTLEFIDPGRLGFEDNAATAETTGKDIVRDAISETYDQYEDVMREDAGPSADEVLDRVLEMVSHRLGGDVEDCEGCCDLPLAHDPVRLAMARGCIADVQLPKLRSIALR